MSSIRAVVLSYNTKDKLKKCMDALQSCSSSDDIRISVVDNGSTDGSVALLKTYQGIQLIESKTNLGFSKANNLILNDFDEEYALILNSDAYVTNNAVKTMLDYMSKHDDVGICAPKALNMDDSLQYSCRRFPNLITSAVHSIMHIFGKENKFSKQYRMEDVSHDRTMDVDWVSGLCMLIKNDTIKRVGSFDEGYFFYMEDVDLCKRMAQHGLRVVYKHDAVVYHETNASGGRSSSLMIKAHHDGMWLYNKKFTGGLGRILLPFIWISIKIREGILLALNKIN